jgi:hypothetical protein
MNQKENPTLSAESPTSLSTPHITRKACTEIPLNLLREINRLMIRVHDKQTCFRLFATHLSITGTTAWLG